mmetsp:Transcript_106015/g.299920  ORF Transcript_106015/g.299920 Transcript_106015/m.299920 type:complete len:292 (+) Transcript_106015:81-956(+)
MSGESSSHCRPEVEAAIHREGDSRDVLRAIGAEERHRRGNLLRLGLPLHGDRLGHLVDDHLRVHTGRGDVGPGLRDHHARDDGVHRDPPARQPPRVVSDECLQCRLGRPPQVVGVILRHVLRRVAARGGDRDHAQLLLRAGAPGLLRLPRDSALDHPGEGLRVHVLVVVVVGEIDRVPGGFRLLGREEGPVPQLLLLPRHARAGAVHEGRDAPPEGVDGLEDRVDRGLLGDVALDQLHDHLLAGNHPLELHLRLLRALDVAGEVQDEVMRLHQLGCDRVRDARRPSGDDGD